METVWQDTRYGFRMLLKNPGFTAVAVAALALGIGVNTTIFALWYAMAFRPLPVKDPSTIVNIYQKFDGEFSRQVHGSPYVFSYPEYVSYRDHAQAFAGLVAYSRADLSLEGQEGEPIQGLLVSCDYFSVLGAGVALGRTFLTQECRTPGTYPVLVLSYRLWQRRFSADANIIGKTVVLNRQPFTVVGVAAPNFVGTEITSPDAWIPLMMETQVLPGRNDFPLPDSGWLNLVGRLRPGLSLKQAQAEMSVLARQSDERYPGRKTSVILTPGAFLSSPEARMKEAVVAVVMMTAVGLVLLIACANVANLLLARATTRQREIGIRLALGATRKRLLQQLLTESLLIALLGGGLGLLLALWLPQLLVHMFTERQLQLNLNPDLHVFGYTLLLSMITGILFGWVPALQSTKLSLTSALKEEAMGFGQRLSRSRLRSLLVMVQVAVCLVLLIGAGLLIRGLQTARSINPGFEIKGIVVASFDLRQQGYDPARAESFHSQLLERLKAQPGVKSVSWASVLPLVPGSSINTVFVGGRNGESQEQVANVNSSAISTDYFQTMGIPIIRGRNFSRRETRSDTLAAIINEAMARRFWPESDAIGEHFKSSSDFYQVVGVAKNTKSVSRAEEDGPLFYALALPNEQLDMKLLVRTDGNEGGVIRAIRNVVRTLDQKVLVSSDRMTDKLQLLLHEFRVAVTLSITLGLLALLLASIGIYGLMAYVVSQRTHEVGVRMALGARLADVLRLILREGAGPVITGVGIGLAGAAALSRILSALLFGLSPFDAIAFFGMSLLLVVVSLVAAYMPAREATKVDPVVALRYE